MTAIQEAIVELSERRNKLDSLISQLQEVEGIPTSQDEHVNRSKVAARHREADEMEAEALARLAANQNACVAKSTPPKPSRTVRRTKPVQAEPATVKFKRANGEVAAVATVDSEITNETSCVSPEAIKLGLSLAEPFGAKDLTIPGPEQRPY